LPLLPARTLTLLTVAVNVVAADEAAPVLAA
jgi:hypothetical protein